MRKFKYKTIKLQEEINDPRLNVFGSKGWELCGVHQDNWGYIYYFKKEISNKKVSDGESDI